MKNLALVTVAFGTFTTINDALAAFSGQVVSESLKVNDNGSPAIGSKTATADGVARFVNLHSEAVSVYIVAGNATTVNNNNCHTLLPGKDVVLTVTSGQKAAVALITE